MNPYARGAAPAAHAAPVAMPYPGGPGGPGGAAPPVVAVAQPVAAPLAPASAAEVAELGRQLYVSSLDATGGGAPPGAALPAGAALPGLSARLKMAAPPQPMLDWTRTHEMHVDEEKLLDCHVKSIKFGLAWDAGTDVDGSCLLFDQHQRLQDTINFHQLHSVFKDAVTHSGDDRTGEGGGDDEVIKVKLRKLPRETTHVLCCVNVYNSNASFQNVRALKVRIYHGSAKPKKRGKVLVQYDMSKVRMTGNSMLVAMLVRKGAWWAIHALGMPAGPSRTAQSLCKTEGALLSSVLRSSTPHAPRRFTITLTVSAARGLASRDMNGKADPFVKLTFRKQETRCEKVRKTLDPDWAGAGRPATLQLRSVDLAEVKKVKISVWDWDRFTNSDFMGRVKIPAGALANLGEGSHRLTERLQPHQKKHPGYDVRGEIVLDVHVAAEN